MPASRRITLGGWVLGRSQAALFLAKTSSYLRFVPVVI
jgi:hypothetical protein